MQGVTQKLLEEIRSRVRLDEEGTRTEDCFRYPTEYWEAFEAWYESDDDGPNLFALRKRLRRRERKRRGLKMPLRAVVRVALADVYANWVREYLAEAA